LNYSAPGYNKKHFQRFLFKGLQQVNITGLKVRNILAPGKTKRRTAESVVRGE